MLRCERQPGTGFALGAGMRQTLCIILFLLLATAPRPALADPTQLCRAAIATAEREAAIPAGLLQAIGRVESGRRNPETGAFGPWPYTINAEGQGRFFPNAPAAIAAVRELQGRGVRVMDVGCMQINLHHHPQAFANLEEAFDPVANARYGAGFLARLNETRRDWAVSASHYHSQTPALADAYRARVMAAWPEEVSRLASNPPGPVMATFRPGANAPAVPSLANGGENARIIPLAGGQGRGLDAYRAQPVPISGRVLAVLPQRLTTR
jgi:hypothetical protein